MISIRAPCKGCVLSDRETEVKSKRKVNEHRAELREGVGILGVYGVREWSVLGVIQVGDVEM